MRLVRSRGWFCKNPPFGQPTNALMACFWDSGIINSFVWDIVGKHHLYTVAGIQTFIKTVLPQIPVFSYPCVLSCEYTSKQFKKFKARIKREFNLVFLCPMVSHMFNFGIPGRAPRYLRFDRNLLTGDHMRFNAQVDRFTYMHSFFASNHRAVVEHQLATLKNGQELQLGDFLVMDANVNEVLQITHFDVDDLDHHVLLARLEGSDDSLLSDDFLHQDSMPKTP